MLGEFENSSWKELASEVHQNVRPIINNLTNETKIIKIKNKFQLEAAFTVAEKRC